MISDDPIRHPVLDHRDDVAAREPALGSDFLLQLFVVADLVIDEFRDGDVFGVQWLLLEPTRLQLECPRCDDGPALLRVSVCPFCSVCI